MADKISEKKVAKDLKKLSKGQLFRNNSGVFIDKRGVPVRFGLANESKNLNKSIKSSDFIGVTQVKIEPHMLGRTIAVFTAVEVKSPGWRPDNSERTKGQQKFIDIIRSWGGIACFAKCGQDYLDAVKKFIA